MDIQCLHLYNTIQTLKEVAKLLIIPLFNSFNFLYAKLWKACPLRTKDWPQIINATKQAIKKFWGLCERYTSNDEKNVIKKINCISLRLVTPCLPDRQAAGFFNCVVLKLMICSLDLLVLLYQDKRTLSMMFLNLLLW